MCRAVHSKACKLYMCMLLKGRHGSIKRGAHKRLRLILRAELTFFFVSELSKAQKSDCDYVPGNGSSTRALLLQKELSNPDRGRMSLLT